MKVLIIILTTIMFTTSLFSAKYAVVISSKSNLEKLSTRQIRDIYLMKRNFVGNQKVLPLNVLASLPLREVFENNVIRMNREKLNDYWIKKHFQGISPPITQSSAKSIKLFIDNVDGAIGYVPLNIIDSSLKVLYEF